jgi:hypothetical protein
MLTRHEAVYAAWYIVLFALLVGWAATRPALQPAVPMEVGNAGAENPNGGKPDAEREPEMRRTTQRMAR